jgi:dTDP-4-amino-4,6-dideoxygalactose transaminase
MKFPNKKNIFVTQPALPPLEEFIPYLQQIWDNKILTNNGPFHQLLEEALCEYLGVKYISLFTNGTIALVTALQALRITGEVITPRHTHSSQLRIPCCGTASSRCSRTLARLRSTSTQPR